ncbi:MAG: pseudouridine synthase [Desulfuromonadales bacterium]|nr:pseudouridine synthase [Desulfuromonadales bacterium]
MGISSHPSTVTLPQIATPYPSLLEFLSHRFPHISREIWARRLVAGKILDAAGAPLTLVSSYQPHLQIRYFREVENESQIPFSESILYQDDDLVVADKPHFLPVTPGGRYVEECLLSRLRRSTGLADLVPLHRIDRETAGIVLFSVNKKTRGCYAGLFLRGEVEKTYQALSASRPGLEGSVWVVENRIERGAPSFRMQVVPGTANARSVITLLECNNGIARFLLQPLTGKTHQLRLHLSSLGCGILNDRFYPKLQAERADNYANPLQLLAQMVRFSDPLSGVIREFVSGRELLC